MLRILKEVRRYLRLQAGICYPLRFHSTVFRRSALLAQFNKIKAQYHDYILLFQVGDFYEIYGKDAELVSAKTNLRVTRRSNTLMAGFPVRSLSEWQRSLVESGFQLAICNQKPAHEGGVSRLLGREVVKLVTPGTLIEPLHHHANYLMAIAPGPTLTSALAWLDLSTADFQVLSTNNESIDEHIERVCPAEILLPQDIHRLLGSQASSVSLSPAVETLLRSSVLREMYITGVPNLWFSDSLSSDIMITCSHIRSLLSELQKSSFSALEHSAACVVLRYILHTQRDLTSLHLKIPAHFTQESHMAIDTNTRRALELTSPLQSNPKSATLLGCVDQTVTAAGGRLLRARLSAPLTDLDEIQGRLTAVEVFLRHPLLTEQVTLLLRGSTDLERVVQKVATGTATSTELLAVKNTLMTAADLRCYLRENFTCYSSELAPDMNGLQEFPELLHELEKGVSGGGGSEDYIMKGYSPEVDHLREKLQENEMRASELCSQIMKEYCVAKLVLAPHKSYVRVLEASKAQSVRAEKCPELVRVDQTQDKVRFSHPRLQRLNAEHQALHLEYSNTQEQLFNVLCDKVKSEADRIMATARSLAKIDVSTSLALVATENGWCKPRVVREHIFAVKGGVHPVVASQQQTGFVGNDCHMNEDSQQLWVVTGPNMGGKSTFLRQNSLIIILAQMGSFVPAQEATIGVVDKLFARVGASDNVVKHMSTFHMEMAETANILSSASSQSFVILDEIGRGTATLEGLAVAQATMEHVHDVLGCRTLLATHFHELAEVASTQLSKAACYRLVAHKDDDGNLVFTYKIAPGYASSSLGIDVAELAGLPKTVIRRAKELLDQYQHCQTPVEGPNNEGKRHTDGALC